MLGPFQIPLQLDVQFFSLNPFHILKTLPCTLSAVACSNALVDSTNREPNLDSSFPDDELRTTKTVKSPKRIET